MKKIIQLTICALLLGACSSLNKMTNEAFYHAVVGQTEKVVYARVGSPSKTYVTEDGGKVLVYEVPEKSFAGYSKNIQPALTRDFDDHGKPDYDVDIWQLTSAASDANKYAEYNMNITGMKIYFNKRGICTRVDQSLPKPQAEYYYHRLKKYVPEK